MGSDLARLDPIITARNEGFAQCFDFLVKGRDLGLILIAALLIDGDAAVQTKDRIVVLLVLICITLDFLFAQRGGHIRR